MRKVHICVYVIIYIYFYTYTKYYKFIFIRIRNFRFTFICFIALLYKYKLSSAFYLHFLFSQSSLLSPALSQLCATSSVRCVDSMNRNDQTRCLKLAARGMNDLSTINGLQKV